MTLYLAQNLYEGLCIFFVYGFVQFLFLRFQCVLRVLKFNALLNLHPYQGLCKVYVYDFDLQLVDAVLIFMVMML